MKNLKWVEFEAYSEAHVNHLFEALNKEHAEKGHLNIEDISEYDLLHPGKHEGIDRFFQEYPVQGPSRLLEIGIGLGGTSRYILATQGISVYGFDYIQRLVDFSVHSNQLLSIPESQILHICGDVCSIDLPQSEFDIAVAIGTFVHIDSDEGYFNVAKAIKPGGLLYIEDYYFAKDRNLFTDSDRDLIEQRHFYGVKTKDEMKMVLESAGLEVLEMNEFGKVWSEAAWNRSEFYAKSRKSGETSISDDLFHQIVQVSTRLTSEMSHFSSDELKAKYPAMSEIFDVVSRANEAPKLVGVSRTIAKKL